MLLVKNCCSTGQDRAGRLLGGRVLGELARELVSFGLRLLASSASNQGGGAGWGALVARELGEQPCHKATSHDRAKYFHLQKKFKFFKNKKLHGHGKVLEKKLHGHGRLLTELASNQSLPISSPPPGCSQSSRAT